MLDDNSMYLFEDSADDIGFMVLLHKVSEIVNSDNMYKALFMFSDEIMPSFKDLHKVFFKVVTKAFKETYNINILSNDEYGILCMHIADNCEIFLREKYNDLIIS